VAKRIKSAIKRAEVAERNRQRNIAVKSEIKTRVKRVNESVAGGAEAATTVELLKVAISRLDRAARKGIIHPNAAARRKSRLVKTLASKGVAL
jgi:small subunit ribosomal protein S20